MPVTVASPTFTPSRYTATTSLPASAAESEPRISGVESLVSAPLATAPCVGSTSSHTVVMVTVCAGAVASTLIV